MTGAGRARQGRTAGSEHDGGLGGMLPVRPTVCTLDNLCLAAPGRFRGPDPTDPPIHVRSLRQTEVLSSESGVVVYNESKNAGSRETARRGVHRLAGAARRFRTAGQSRTFSEVLVGDWHASVDIPSSELGPKAARDIVGALLSAWDLAELRDGAVIVVSELVTNAYVHASGRDTFELEVVRRGPGIRIALADGTAVKPMIQELSDTRTAGRGMRIVAALASDWGTRKSGRQAGLGGPRPAGVTSRPRRRGAQPQDSSRKSSVVAQRPRCPGSGRRTTAGRPAPSIARASCSLDRLSGPAADSLNAP